jgi:16S rRNA processing protein RimM
VTSYYLIASIEQLSGNNGFVRIKAYSDFPERFLNLQKTYIDFWGDKKVFFVEEVRKQRDNYLLKFKKFDTQRDSRVLIGREIFVDDSDVAKLPENHFFVHDLLGCKVFIKDEIIGVVKDVLKLPANDVIVLELYDGKEKMIPFVLDFIDSFDPVKGKLFLRIAKDFLEEDED